MACPCRIYANSYSTALANIDQAKGEAMECPVSGQLRMSQVRYCSGLFTVPALWSSLCNVSAPGIKGHCIIGRRLVIGPFASVHESIRYTHPPIHPILQRRHPGDLSRNSELDKGNPRPPFVRFFVAAGSGVLGGSSPSQRFPTYSYI
jgi:hypothetical protein